MTARADGTGREERRRRPVGYFDLVRDLRSQGCAVCHGESRSAWRYLDGLLWEGVTDGGVRTATRAAHGFCREHALMALSVASQESGQLGMAILFEDLLAHVQTEARDLAARRSRRRANHGSQPLAPHAVYHPCASGRATAANYLLILAVEGPSSDVGAAARIGGSHLCLPHLRMGVGLAVSDQQRDRLIEVFLIGGDQLRSELREFIRKRDYRFSDEVVTKEESSAWIRAVHTMVGDPRRRTRPR